MWTALDELDADHMLNAGIISYLQYASLNFFDAEKDVNMLIWQIDIVQGDNANEDGASRVTRERRELAKNQTSNFKTRESSR